MMKFIKIIKRMLLPFYHIFAINNSWLLQILFIHCFYSFLSLIYSENWSFFGYTNSSLIHLTNTPSTTLSILPSIYPLPASFIALNEVILGIEISPSGRNALLFTSSSICIFMTSRGKWITAIQFISVYISSLIFIYRMVVLLLVVG